MNCYVYMVNWYINSNVKLVSRLCTLYTHVYFWAEYSVFCTNVRNTGPYSLTSAHLLIDLGTRGPSFLHYDVLMRILGCN